MTNKTIEEAQEHLAEILENMLYGEEISLFKDGKLYAKLKREPILPDKPRVPGSAAHTDHWMADDFDEPLEDMKPYM